MKLLVLRFHLRAAAVGFFLVLVAGTVVVFLQPRIHRAEGSMKYYLGDRVVDDSVPLAVDTQVIRTSVADYGPQLLNQALLEKVGGRLTEHERLSLTASSFLGVDDGPREIAYSLKERVSVEVNSWVVTISYRCADRQLAARLVDLHMEEWIADTTRISAEQNQDAYGDLSHRANWFTAELEALRKRVSDYRAAHVGWSSDQFETDQAYRNLRREVEATQALMMGVQQRLNETKFLLTNPAGWTLLRRASVPAEGDYLLMPLFLNWLIALAVAVTTGGLCGVLASPLHRVFEGRFRGRA